MPIRVLMLCCRENAGNILGCLVGQPDVSVNYCPGIEEFRSRLEDECFDLIVVDQVKQSKPGTAFVRDIHQRQSAAMIVLIWLPGALTVRKRLREAPWCRTLSHPAPPCEIQREIDQLRVRMASGGQGERTQIVTPGFPPFLVGEHSRMLMLKDALLKAASSDLPVLMFSEPGCGKELAANAVHYLSPRREFAFARVLCSTYSEEALDRRLFGSLRDSGGRAPGIEPGYMDTADRGTLLLDMVDALGPGTQARLLRVLEEKTFERIGGSETMTCDVRFVFSTTTDLHARAHDGRFGEDLYYRLSALVIVVPPLRDRKTDIALLARHFVKKHCILQHYPELAAKESFLDALHRNDWHGNVRELENVIERAIILGGGKDLSREHLPTYVKQPDEATPFPPARVQEYPVAFKIARRQFEREFLTMALAKYKANISHTAGAIGITRRNLQIKIKQLSIEVERLKRRDSPGEVSA